MDLTQIFLEQMGFRKGNRDLLDHPGDTCSQGHPFGDAEDCANCPTERDLVEDAADYPPAGESCDREAQPTRRSRRSDGLHGRHHCDYGLRRVAALQMLDQGRWFPVRSLPRSGTSARREGATMITNVPLLRKALEFAETHPEEIELGSWAEKTACGTTACIAGTVAILTGHQLKWESDKDGVFADRVTDGRSIESVAMTELGIDDGAAYQLFYCIDLDEVWMIAEKLTNGELQRPVK